MRNFAVVGPSRMGKTSLVRQHLGRWRGGEITKPQQFYCDLYNVQTTDEAMARTLRMAIEPGAHAYYDKPENLQHFLHKVRSNLGVPFEIVLDEVDKHCGLDLFGQLIHMAQPDLCRLIFVGRWKLMRAAEYARDDNLTRLETIIIEPFEFEDGEALIEKPLGDCLIDFSPARRELRAAIKTCGLVPGHLQEFAAYLVEELGDSPERLEEGHIRRALNRIFNSSHLCGLLDDLSGPHARSAALVIALFGKKGEEIDALWLQQAMAERKVQFSVRLCMEICDELMIHHLLACEHGVYRICRWDYASESRRERPLYEAMLREEIAEILNQKCNAN